MIEQILQADRYLQVDQVEKAREVYQKVVDMDPGNAIAVVGLARCALADGDDQRAYALASRALEIDPENDMARRMEARLSEILATRGQSVDRPAAASAPSSIEMRAVVTDTPDDPSAVPAAPAGAANAVPAAPAGAANASPATPTAPPVARPTSPNATAVAKPTPSTTAARPSAARPSTPPPPKAKEPAVRKSLFDRLLGR